MELFADLSLQHITLIQQIEELGKCRGCVR